jgi:hypothetical protein
MAIQYKIYSLGIQKIVEVINSVSNTVLGVNRYNAKEIKAVNNNGTIQVRDSITENVLYEGNVVNFIDKNGAAWGTDAENLINNLSLELTRLDVNLQDLNNIEEVEGILAPDLSAYAKTADITTAISTFETTINSEINSINNTLNSSVEKYLGKTLTSRKIRVDQVSAIASQDTSVTFTVPPSGKFRIIYEDLEITIDNAATVYGHLSLVDPGQPDVTFTEIRLDEGGDGYSTSNFIDDMLGTLNNLGMLTRNNNLNFGRVTFIRHPQNNVPFPQLVRQTVTASFSQFLDGTLLTPGEEITVHLWFQTGVSAGWVDFLFSKILVIEIPN